MQTNDAASVTTGDSATPDATVGGGPVGTLNDDGTTTIGVGLISVGWMGQLHSRAYSNLRYVYPDLKIRPRLVHAADPAPARAQEAVEVLGYERASADYHEVLNDPEVDVVSICAPNFLHAEIGIAAAKAGKHFWIEKPVGRGEAETRSVAEAAAEAGVVTSIGFNYRHAPAVEYLRELVAEGKLGRITNVRGKMFADYSSDPRGALSWRFIRGLAGSGVLGDLMGHMVDLVQYTLGPVAEVTAVTSTVYTERPELPMGTGTHFAVIENGDMKPVENEDYAAMLVRLSGDAVAADAVGSLEASRVAVGPRASYGIEVYGTEGSAHWDFESMNELHLSGGLGTENQGYTRIMARPGMGDFGRFQPGSGTSMGYDDLKVVEARKFLQAVLGRETLNSNIQDALSANQVVSAAERSAETRNWESSAPVAGTTAAVRA
ncbi:MAG: Gfo/Idh/MocA family protein [Leucobacter sp.]